jgi:hypothetical protein
MPLKTDDLRHVLTPGPHARESLFYSLLLPDEQLMVFTYTWVGHDNRAGHLFGVAGESNERHAISAVDGVDVGERDFDDWAVGGVQVRHVDLLRRAELAVELEGVSFHASYEGVHETFSYLDNQDGCPSFVADDRFEQSCRVRGTLTLAGREIAFDTTGHRDHSWGTRDWDTFQDWKWISAQAGPDLGLNLLLMHARGETTTHGYVFRDGLLAPVVSARAGAGFDERFWQTGGEAEIVDDRGRETAVHIERFALFSFEAGERTVLNEAGCTGTIDGAPALVHFECGWDRTYAALQASRAAGTSASASAILSS